MTHIYNTITECVPKHNSISNFVLTKQNRSCSGFLISTTGLNKVSFHSPFPQCFRQKESLGLIVYIYKLWRLKSYTLFDNYRQIDIFKHILHALGKKVFILTNVVFFLFQKFCMVLRTYFLFVLYNPWANIVLKITSSAAENFK